MQRLLLAPLAALLIAVTCVGARAQAILSNDKFVATVSTTTGGITSLTLKNDVYPTDYIWSGRNIGDVLMTYHIGMGAWKTGNTSSSADRRTIINEAPSKLQVNYTVDSSSTTGIKGFSLYETYELQGDALLWTIRIKNRSAAYLELGTLGLPLFFNTGYETTQTVIMTQRVIRHSFIGGDGSYIFCGRSSGIGPYLVMTPMQGTRLEYFTDSGNPYDYTAYVHASHKANPTGYVGGAWRIPTTSGILAAAGTAGDEVTYGFRFTWANDYAGVRQAIVRDGHIDVQSVPGMTVPENTDVGLSLTTNQTINSITAEHPSNTTITYVGRKYGNVSVYNVRFSKIGENRLTVDYGAGRKLYLEYFCTQAVETLIQKRANFIATKQQWKNPAKWYNGLFSLWDMKNHILQSPDNPGTGMMAYCVGGSDDPSNCKGPYLALKNLTFPVQSEIDAVDYHLQNFVWGGLQKKTTESYPYGIYSIDNWYVNRNAHNNNLGRIYDYPAMIAMYYDMYKIAKLYPTMPKYLTASGYLDRAFGTAQAFFTIPLAVRGWSAYSLGLYNEQCIPDLINALNAEGRTANASYLRNEWENKVKYFVNDNPWPFGSEYSFDSTAYETSQLLASYGVENNMSSVTKEAARAFMEKQMSANIADRGWLEPCYYQMGGDIRACSNAIYILTYMSQMGGTGVLDYALHYTNDPVTYLRLGYASYMSCWALINAGDASSNYGYWFPGIGNDGAAAWAYEPQQTGGMWCNGQTIGRWAWNYDGEIDHGFMGGLRSAATIVAGDPIFGLMAYGGTLSQVGSSINVTPADGIRQRFHMINVTPALHVELGRDRFASIQATTSADNSINQLTFTLENATSDAHNTDITINGLPSGSYRATANGVTQYIQVTSGPTVVHFALPSNATCICSISLATTVHGFVRNAGGVPIPNAAVQVGGFGGPAGVSGSDGSYSIRVPATGKQLLYADALGYAGKYVQITTTANSDLTRDITLNAAPETGVITNGSFETAGAGGASTANGWQWVHTSDPTGTDYVGLAWPAMNSNMYSGTRNTTQNQTPGGSACGTLLTGTPISSPGAVSESTIPAWGTVNTLTATTITVPGVSWVVNQWLNYDLIVQSGALRKHYVIANNSTNTVVIRSGNLISDGFAAGCGYEICKMNRKYWYPGWLSQTIPVDPSCLYNFYFKGCLSGNAGAFWKFRWLDVNHGEILSWVDPRADSTWPDSPSWQQYLSGMYYQNGWQRNVPMLRMAPPSGAKYVEVEFGFTDDTAQSRTGAILVDDVVVDKLPPASVAMASMGSEGDYVSLVGKTVTIAPRNASGARSTNYFYVEETDRSSAIRVEDGSTGQDAISQGQGATVSGVVKIKPDTGERYIELDSTPTGGTGTTVKALGVTTKTVQTDTFIVGRLVRASGTVKQVASDGTWFTIADGYTVNGVEVITKVRVDGAPLSSGTVHERDPIAVTGVVSIDTGGARLIIFRGF